MFNWKYNEEWDEVLDENGNNVRDYNCGGFALNTRDWYRPYPEDYLCIWELEQELGLEAGTEECVTHMLVEFPTLRLIGSEDEAEEDESVIFFRIGGGDFHFVRKGADGNYYHKMGSSEEVDEMEREEVYGIEWCCRYDGPLVIFAYKDKFYWEVA